MQSRLSRYNSDNKKRLERSQKNTKLYEEVYDDVYRNATYQNMEVISAAKEINLNKLKDILDDSYDTRQYRTLKKYSLDDIDEKPIPKQKKRVYDINEIINEAKSKRTFIEEAKEKQKYMDYAKRNSKYEERYNELKKEEEELEELINTMVISKKEENTDDELDLLSDLKGNEDTIVTNPIQTDLDKTDADLVQDKTNVNADLDTSVGTTKGLNKVDKTFYTDSNMFTKNDFEDFTGLSRSLKGGSKVKKIIIILLILIIIGVLAYFGITKYILK